MNLLLGAEQERLAEMPEEDLEEMDEEYMLVARMEAGLFTLQQTALIMGHLWFYGDIGLRKRILLLLHQQARPPVQLSERKIKTQRPTIFPPSTLQMACLQQGPVALYRAACRLFSAALSIFGKEGMARWRLSRRL